MNTNDETVRCKAHLCRWLTVFAAVMQVDSSGAAPAPNSPALAVRHDPYFIPLAVTGSGFGSSQVGSQLVVESELGSVTLDSVNNQCPEPPYDCAPPASCPACIIFWGEDSIAARLSPTFTSASARVITNQGQSDPIPARYYTYEFFDIEQVIGGGNPVPLAIGLDPTGRVWINSEFATHFNTVDPQTGDSFEPPMYYPDPPPFAVRQFPPPPNPPTWVPSEISALGEDVMVDPYGRVWLVQGGGLFGPNGIPNHSRIVMYTGAGATPVVYNVPGDHSEVFALAFEENYVPGKDRIWYGARKQRIFFPSSAYLNARVGWFEVGSALGWPEGNDGSDAFSTTTTCIPNRICQDFTLPGVSCMADSDCLPQCVAGQCRLGQSGACTTDQDCAPHCVNGTCAGGNMRSCSTDAQCIPTCAFSACSDNPNRACASQNDRPDGSNEDCVYSDVVCGGADSDLDCIFHEFPLKFTTFATFHMLVDDDGGLWITDWFGESSLMRMETATGELTVFPLGDDPNRGFPNWPNGSVPNEVVQLANDDIIANEVHDFILNRLDFALRNDPDCTQLDGLQNPCMTSLAVPGPSMETQAASCVATCGEECPLEIYSTHDMTRDDNDTVWFTTGGSFSNPISRATVGYVKRDWAGMLLFPPLSVYEFTAPNNSFCNPSPNCSGSFRAFEGSGIEVESSSERVYFGDYCRKRIGRLTPTVTNLALDRPAQQSATPCYFGNCGTADRANDGNVDGAFGKMSVAIATKVNNYAWWQVDLGAASWLEEIEVWPRTDVCCTQDLADFKVFISDVPFSTNPAAVETQAGVTTIHEPLVATRPWTADIDRTGRYVRVQMPAGAPRPIQLAEVSVLGAPLCANDPTCNRAKGKTATQSSTYNGYSASRAVDGNVDGNLLAGSVTHTGLDAQAWWQIDLGAPYEIEDIELWNRTDCPWPCSARLREFYVFASNTPFVSTNPTQVQNQFGVTTIYEPDTVGRRWRAPLNRTARYVRVQFAGTRQLSLAEVVLSSENLP